MADYPSKMFYGTAQTVFDLATDIGNGNFSAAGTTYNNTTDAAVPNAPYAKAMAEFPDWAAAPSAGASVELWGLEIDTDGTDDDTDAPSGTASGGARLFGAWVLAATDALQRRTIVISTLGIKTVAFYLKNNSGVNMNNDAVTNCIVKITPFSVGVTI